jgi:hypothetical protein
METIPAPRGDERNSAEKGGMVMSRQPGDKGDPPNAISTVCRQDLEGGALGIQPPHEATADR